MKAEITQEGVFDQTGNRVPVGTVIEVSGDDLPAWLANKARPVAAEAVTTPKKPAKSAEA